MNKGRFLGRRKRKFPKYNPSREEISKAVSEFLQKGGKIKILNPQETPFEKDAKTKEGRLMVDNYLMEQDNSPIDGLL